LRRRGSKNGLKNNLKRISLSRKSIRLSLMKNRVSNKRKSSNESKKKRSEENSKKANSRVIPAPTTKFSLSRRMNKQKVAMPQALVLEVASLHSREWARKEESPLLDTCLDLERRFPRKS